MTISELDRMAQAANEAGRRLIDLVRQETVMGQEMKHTPTPWKVEHPAGGGRTLVAKLPFHPYGKDSDFWKPEADKWHTIFRLPRLQDVRIYIAEDGNFYMWLAYEDWCQFPCQEWKDTQDANAEFIVRACNSHEQLLEACREARDFIGTRCTCPELNGDGSCPACLVYYQLHEVLSESDERRRPSASASPSAPSPG